jgi:hypothetical protein
VLKSPWAQNLYGPFQWNASFFLFFLNRVCKGCISQRYVCCFEELKARLFCVDSAEENLLAQSTLCLCVRLATVKNPSLSVSWYSWIPWDSVLSWGLLLPALHFCFCHSPATGPSGCNKPQVLQTLNWNWMLD